MSFVGGLGARYLLVSGLALALDYASAWVFASFGLWVPFATSLGYVVGLLLAFPMMRSFVFRTAGRKFERLPLYLVSGLIGVSVTYATSYIVAELFGQGFHLTKILSAGLSFVTVFLFRNFLVFRTSISQA